MTISLVPKPAAFVVIRIDPVATLESLNDPIATAAAGNMSSKKYVAYVSKAINVFDVRAPHHTYAIQLTSPRIPEPCEADGISADMYTPVFPATAHPLGREPLRPKKALPWACYQPSFMRSIVRVPVQLADDAAAASLDSGDAIHHRRILAGEDLRRSVSLHSSTPEAKTDGLGYVNFSDLDEYTGEFACPIEVDRAYEDKYYVDTVEASQPPNTMIVVDVSYDLSEVDELPDPLEFFEEKRRLKQLEAESKARKEGCPEITISQPETENIAENIQHGVPVTEERQSFVYPETPWSFWDTEHRKLPALVSTIRIPASLIQDAVRKTRHFSGVLANIREDGLNVLQSWAIRIRLI
ncbi:hypothetical protein C8R44DRAFT_756752 [Mycena epipterygia]|nr:hypothetical protein C8R44DRAFT_756752 [Mycena epipterygia]